jgi:glucose/arabinose dehydrogenase
MQQAPGGGDWYLVERTGRIHRFADRQDARAATLFADLGERINAGPLEAGLLGMAFDPDFRRNRRVYLSYTRGRLESVIARYRVGAHGRLDPASESVILTLEQPYANHNGGQIAFGPDGMLYIGFGDGGAAGDPGNRAQDLGNWFGAFLRIDVSGRQGYRVPPDNPFVDRPGARPEIYAYGLRNPWRWSFDRRTGALWAGDVGQNAVEEVNVIRAGGNHGWRCYEGSRPFRPEGCPPRERLVFPVAEYPNPEEGRSVIGGYVYRGTEIPALEGVYVFGDFVSGTVWGLFPQPDGSRERRVLARTELGISSFAEGADGTLYLLDFRGGRIHRIAPAGADAAAPKPPVAGP